eukprot:54943_1
MAEQSSEQRPNITLITLPEQGILNWKVTGDLLQEFQGAQHKQEFVSPEFTTTDGTIWRIQFYPRGKTSEHCSIFLQSLTLAPNKERIGVNYSLNIAEVDWCNDSAETFIKDGDTWGKNEAFLSKKLDNLPVLTIQCVVEETMDVTNGNEYFEWTVGSYSLQKWKNAKHKGKLYSPSFKSIGGEWHLRIIPNGWSTEGIAELDIQCKGVESDEKDTINNVCHYADIMALNYCQMYLDGTNTDKGDWFEFKSPFRLADLDRVSEITICIKLWKKECVDKNEAQTIANLYESQRISPKEWRQYFITETNQVAKWLFRLELTQYAPIFKETGYETIRQLKGLTEKDLANMGVDVDAHGKAILYGITAHLNRVTTFLSHLGLEQYTPIFKENACGTMQDIEELSNDDLKDMGIKAYAHRKRILKGIHAHFNVEVNAAKTKEESKQNNVDIDVDRLNKTDIAMMLQILKKVYLTADIEEDAESCELLCPITKSIMKDPVICSDGHSYERSAIEEWLKRHDRSPMTNAKLVTKQVFPNHSLRSMIAMQNTINKKLKK